jgi:gliding motility-associated-like protein
LKLILTYCINGRKEANKGLLLFLFILVFGLNLKAQVNLVPNGGMEINPNCNTYVPYCNVKYQDPLVSLYYKTNYSYWYCTSPTAHGGRPRYLGILDSCPFGFTKFKSGKYSLISPPVTYGVNNYNGGFNNRYYTYIGTGLTSKLEKDSVYRAEMWVAKGSSSTNSISGIGMYFADDSAYVNMEGPPTFGNGNKQIYVPQKQALMNKRNNYITAPPSAGASFTQPWQRIRFYYTAKGTERFLILGDFESNAPCHKLDAPDSFTLGPNGESIIPPIVNPYPNTDLLSSIILDDILVVKIPKSTRKDLVICKNTSASLTIRADFDSCIWHDGSKVSNRSFNIPGIYWVKSFGWTEWVVDSLVINVLEPGIYTKDTTIEFNTVLKAPAGQQYLWNTGDSSQSIRILNPGKYWVTSKTNLCSRIDTFRVSITNPKGMVIDTSLCYGRSIKFGKRADMPKAMWHDGDTSSSRTFNITGTYWVKSEYSATIYLVDTLKLVIQQPNNSNIDTGFCFGKQLVLKTDSGYKNTWVTGDTSLQITVNKAGIYWVEKEKEGCLQYDSFVVQLLPALSHSLTDTGFCVGTSIVLNAGIGWGFEWENKDTMPLRQISEAGLYWVSKATPYCPAIDSFKVSEYPLPIIDIATETGVCFKELEELKLDAGNFKSYLWEPGNETSRTKVFSQAQYQTLTVTDNHHCSSSKLLNIIEWCEDAFYLPNAFTPNRDGLNETFKPVMNNAVFFGMEIYIRWGEKVYTSNNASIGWDGTYNGQPMPAGVYIATIKYQQRGKQEKSASLNFTLLR